MRQRKARLVGLLVVATASTAVLTGGPTEAAPAIPPATTLGMLTTVTLVTGDVVTLGGTNGVDVVAARGREKIGFRAEKDVDGDIHVIPDDARAGLNAGKLDPRLFDVTELARNGYDDAHRKDVPLIVDYPGATPKAAGARAVRELPSLGAVAMRADKNTTFWASRDQAAKIWLDGPVKASLDHSVAQIGAPEAWAAGHTGAGTTVAVLDTGIDTTHPDLDDAVAGAQDFTGSASGTDDHIGHGTHVASIITGSGDRYQGVAPDTKLLNGKVLDDTGSGEESWIIAGMEWAAANGADVINMSLGSPWLSDGTDPVSLAVNRITANTGALFVVSAGNEGPNATTIGSPAAADAALTVGAVDRDDQLARFSSRGPRYGDGAIKPDITAPGVGIVAAKAAHGQIGTPAGAGYVSLSGTSMAAPHVAGAAAILAGEHPDWPPDRLKSTLMSSAAANPDLSAFEQGAGRVDVAAAVRATVSTSPVSLALGTVQWPHHDDVPVTKTITYTNAGAAPVTLDLAADVTGPDGNPAPAGMFTLSPAQVTIPAGGSADVTLTTDTRVAGADGSYSGAVVATSGETTTRTPVALHREIESYDVKLSFVDFDGNPTLGYTFQFVDPVNPKNYWGYGSSGTVVLRVPKGTYYFDGDVTAYSDDYNWSRTTDFAEPALVVDATHTEYTFDARDGVPVGLSIDEPTAAMGSGQVSYLMDTEWGEAGSIRYRPGFVNYYSRPSRTEAPGDFEFAMEAEFAKPDGTGQWPGFYASPYLYHVRDVHDGAVPADLTTRVLRRHLAKVVSTHAVATPGRIGIRDGLVSMPLPYTLTEYYSPGTEWTPNFTETIAGNVTSPDGMFGGVVTPRPYELGQTYHERWNTGVFGPGLAYNPNEQGRYFARLGNQFRAVIGLFGDGSADTEGRFCEPWGAFPPGMTQVIRDGEVIHENRWPGDIFFPITLPPDEATYTLRAVAYTSGRLSTRVDAEWTFRSGPVAGPAPKPIPALAVRLAPVLDDHNAAPAGKRFRIPVLIQRNGVEQPGQVNPPTVEISYNEGQTWQKATMTNRNGQWQADVLHPRGALFASLRWSISDNEGNTAKATIIRAYALK